MARIRKRPTMQSKTNSNKIPVLARGVIIEGHHILLAYDPREHPNHL